MHRAVLALALVAAAGCGGGSDAAGPQPAPAPKAVHGLYRAAGARLFMDCRGAGPRTVVLDSGLGVDSNATWAAVRPAVARFARVCQYDRAGMGSARACASPTSWPATRRCARTAPSPPSS
jgi:hypothetical protein